MTADLYGFAWMKGYGDFKDKCGITGKSKNKGKGNKSVASPFGLCSCLRQSGGRFATGVLTPG